MTDRWMRSPRGKIFGVATGLAEWKDLPAEPVRLIVFFTILFTGFFPGAIIYLIIALFLPLRTEGDYYEPAGERKHTAGKYDHIYKNADDVHYEEAGKSTEDLKAEYEELRKKVETMENEMFDKEREWDEKFNREN